jgi:hypothetical protein
MSYRSLRVLVFAFVRLRAFALFVRMENQQLVHSRMSNLGRATVITNVIKIR